MRKHLPSIVLENLLFLGKAIATARKQKHWSQLALSERMGISRQTIARLEKGDPNVTAAHYFTAAWLLDIAALSDPNALLTFMSKPANNLMQRKEPIDDDF